MQPSEVKAKSRARWRRVFLRAPFENPFYDSSDPKLWAQEIEIIERMLAGKNQLVQDRHYLESRDTYVIGWYWDEDPHYPAQWDGPVEQLISRGVIRSSRCAGGFTRMIFTRDAAKVLGITDPHAYALAALAAAGK